MKRINQFGTKLSLHEYDDNIVIYDYQIWETWHIEYHGMRVWPMIRETILGTFWYYNIQIFYTFVGWLLV